MLWLRLLGLVFGVTVYAASTVWAVFMAGLAIGSFAGGRMADRVRRPLVWLGIAEALIGITALFTPSALDVLQRFYARVHASVGDSETTLILVRLVMSFAVLIVPSALMGATLPLVVKSSLFGAQGLGVRVGVLYATNTAGAIAGSLAAGLAFIPRYGIETSFLIAAGCNGLVAIVAVLVGGALPLAAVGPARESTPAGAIIRASTTPQRVVLVVFAISGFVSLGLEVVWFRVGILFLRPTVYGYSMMLAAVLTGIAVGSYIAAPWLRRPRPTNWLIVLAVLQGAIASAALLSFATLPAIPRIVAAIAPALAPHVGDYLAYQAIVSFTMILPAMLASGIAFPIGLRLWTGPAESAAVATRLGVFYSLNVAGAILGSLGVGFVLLPRLGSRGTLWLLAALSLMCALALLAVAPRTKGRRLATIGVLAFGGAATPYVADPFEAFLAQRHPDQTIVWKREAVQATVSVHQDRGGTRTLHVSGNHQGGGSGVFHHQIGNLPMIVHPHAHDALVIGLGGGATAGALSQHTGVDVDVVELSREVAQAAARFFRPLNFDVLRKPTVRLHVDDGRNYLLLTRKRYDVITADVILPIHAGSGNLYSAEYFQLVRRALKPRGIAVQWVAGTDAEYMTIARTFLSVFPETTVWGNGTLLLGSVEPLRLRKSDFEIKWRVPARREMIAMLGVYSFDDLLRQFVAGPSELRQFVGEGPILTDDRPLVEYFLSLPRDRDPNLKSLRGDVRPYVDGL